MPRPIQSFTPQDKTLSMVFLVSSSGTATTYSDFNTKDGSIDYFGTHLRQAFDYTLIDNLGGGLIRVCYNKPEYDLTNYAIGAKTLKAGDALYIEEEVWHLRIYYIVPSIVELVFKSDKDQS